MKPAVIAKLDSKIFGRDKLQQVLSLENINAIGKPTLVSFVNPFSYMALLQSPDLIDATDIFFIDGALLCNMHNWFAKGEKVERLSFDFSSIADSVFSYCSEQNYKVGLVGGSVSDINGALSYLRGRYPQCEFAYVRNGFFDNSKEQAQCYQELTKLKIDVLICGMGTPQQEAFIAKAATYHPDLRIAFTCGGFLSQTSQRGDYYFPLVKRLGLRWLQRMVMHAHVRERVFKQYPWFLFYYLKSHLGR